MAASALWRRQVASGSRRRGRGGRGAGGEVEGSGQRHGLPPAFRTALPEMAGPEAPPGARRRPNSLPPRRGRNGAAERASGTPHAITRVGGLESAAGRLPLGPTGRCRQDGSGKATSQRGASTVTLGFHSGRGRRACHAPASRAARSRVRGDDRGSRGGRERGLLERPPERHVLVLGGGVLRRRALVGADAARHATLSMASACNFAALLLLPRGEAMVAAAGAGLVAEALGCASPRRASCSTRPVGARGVRERLDARGALGRRLLRGAPGSAHRLLPFLAAASDVHRGQLRRGERDRGDHQRHLAVRRRRQNFGSAYEQIPNAALFSIGR